MKDHETNRLVAHALRQLAEELRKEITIQKHRLLFIEQLQADFEHRAAEAHDKRQNH